MDNVIDIDELQSIQWTTVRNIDECDNEYLMRLIFLSKVGRGNDEVKEMYELLWGK